MSASVKVSPEVAAADQEFLKKNAAAGERRIVRHSKQACWTHGITVIACILLCISGLFVFVPALGQMVGTQTVFAIRMSHRVLGLIFVLVPIVSAIAAPKGVAHIFKNLFARWNSDDKKWMLLFFPYLFMAKWIHMPHHLGCGRLVVAAAGWPASPSSPSAAAGRSSRSRRRCRSCARARRKPGRARRRMPARWRRSSAPWRR